MRISFFGKLREALGDELVVSTDRGETVARLRRRLAELNPQASRDLLSPRVRACIGDTTVGEDFVVDGHDSVEFLPPLSGG